MRKKKKKPDILIKKYRALIKLKKIIIWLKLINN